MARLILDTNALIQLDRRGLSAFRLDDADELAIGTITLAELRHGALAANDSNRPAREQFIRDVEDSIEVLPYTRSTAYEHAVLLDHVRRTGQPRGAHDLIIAAHARQSDRTIVSRDLKARFGDLPGVAVREMP